MKVKEAVMCLKTLYDGGGVGDRHWAVVRDRQQLVCRHGKSVLVAAVMKGTDGKGEKVQLPVSQTLPENYG